MKKIQRDDVVAFVFDPSDCARALRTGRLIPDDMMPPKTEPPPKGDDMMPPKTDRDRDRKGGRK